MIKASTCFFFSCLYFWLHIAEESPETGLGWESGDLVGQLREAALAMTGALGEGMLRWAPADLTQADNTTGMNRLIPEPCIWIRSLKLENILSDVWHFVNFCFMKR